MAPRNFCKPQFHHGDEGVALYNHERQLTVWFWGDTGLRAFLPSALPAHDSVYAMTIHKSQGSEFDTVTLVLPDYEVPVLTRELVYTGLTPARKRLEILPGRESLRGAVLRRVARVSGISGRLGARCKI